MRLSADTTYKAKTRQVARSRGQECGDIELPGYLANAADPVPLVLDLHIAHERWGSSSDPTLNGNLHYPNDIAITFANISSINLVSIFRC
jgi:hypothetical protein